MNPTRISLSLLLGSLLLVGMISYTIAEEMTLSTFYPSPRGVYDQLQAKRYYDFDAGPTVLPASSQRFVDPNGTSQLQSATFSGQLTMGTRNILTWEQMLPAGTVLLFNTACPPGYTNLASLPDLAGRAPRIADVPGGTGGDTSMITGGPTSTVPAQVGGGSTGSGTHTHQYLPPYRDFVFCRRNN